MLQIVEIGIILGLIVWQGLVYRKNRVLIGQVQAMYPANEELEIKKSRTADPRIEGLSKLEQIRQGQAVFTWLERYPDEELIINGTDEAGRVLFQKLNEAENQFVKHGTMGAEAFEQLLGDGKLAFVMSLSDTIEYDKVEPKNPAVISLQFTQILNDTNDYLQANKGAAAAFDTLRDISEREANLLDEEIQAQISTPLYLGLLGTFGGAILGLLALVNPFGSSSAGFDNHDVTDFLGGVLIAMVGSIFGLGFTLLGNQQLKTARATRDRLKNAYYNFLQKALLPKLNSDMQQSMSSLKAVLDTFNQDFFSKIQTGFFSKIAEFTPLIGAITANITIQKDFLEKLQNIGYTQLANATIKVFDRVDESAASFEKFLGYQQALNVAVSKGAETATVITALLNRLGSLEKALNEVPGYLAQHDERIRDQVRFFGQHNQLLTNVGAKINETLNEDAAQMHRVLDGRRRTLEAEAQAAHVQWEAHFRQLNEGNIYQKITEYLSPFQQLPAQQQALNKLQEEQAKRSAAALTALQQRIERDEQVQRQLLAQITRTNAVLEKLTEPKWYQRMFGAGKTPPAQ